MSNKERKENQANRKAEALLIKAIEKKSKLSVLILLQAGVNIYAKAGFDKPIVEIAELNARRSGDPVTIEIVKLLRDWQNPALRESIKESLIASPFLEKDSSGILTLPSEIRSGILEVVQLLLREGADIDQPDLLGNTPLLNAVYLKDKQLVLILLQAGANMQAKNRQGKTVLEMAQANAESGEPFARGILQLLQDWQNPKLHQILIAWSLSQKNPAISPMADGSPYSSLLQQPDEAKLQRAKSVEAVESVTYAFDRAPEAKQYVNKDTIPILTSAHYFSLYLAPTGFGKSYMLSRLRAVYESKKNSWICFSLKHIQAESFEKALQQFSYQMAIVYEDVFKRYGIQPKDMTEERQKDVQTIIQLAGSQSDIEYSLGNLAASVYEQLQTRIRILIDDCDVPLYAAYRHGYYKKMRNFLCNLYGHITQGNFAVIRIIFTGTLPFFYDTYIQYRLFTAANHADYFGFLRDEVKQLLTNVFGEQPSSLLEQIEQWYGGYQFGEHMVFKPKSVLCFIEDNRKLNERERFVFKNYTSEHNADPLNSLLSNVTPKIKAEFKQLLLTGRFDKKIDSVFSIDNLVKDPNCIWDFLAASGYLTAVYEDPDIGIPKLAELLIPNKEMQLCIAGWVKRWFPAEKIVVPKFRQEARKKQQAADQKKGNKHKLNLTLVAAAIRDKKDEKVQNLLTLNADTNSSEDALTPLYHACFHGKTDIVKLLLEKNASVDGISSDVTVRHVDTLTPLEKTVSMLASWYHREASIVTLLVAKGAYISPFVKMIAEKHPWINFYIQEGLRIFQKQTQTKNKPSEAKFFHAVPSQIEALFNKTGIDKAFLMECYRNKSDGRYYRILMLQNYIQNFKARNLKLGLSLQQALDTKKLECEHLSRGFPYVKMNIIEIEHLRTLTVEQYACLRYCAKYIDNFNHGRTPSLSLDDVLALQVSEADNLEASYNVIADGSLTIEEVRGGRRQRYMF